MANMYRTSAPTDSGSVNYHIADYALAQGLGRLNKDLVVTKLITNLSAQAKAQGSRFAENVRIPFTGSVAITDKTPGSAVTPVASTSTKVDIAVNKHKTWDALVEDYGSLFAQEGLLTQYVMDASSAMAEAIETDVIALYASASGQVGTAEAGASSTLIRTVRETARGATHLFNLSQPSYIVWGVQAEADLLGDALFNQYLQSGTTDALERAKLGTKFGFENYTSNLIAVVAGSPTAEHNIAFQKDAMGIAFVDMNTQTIPDTYTGGVMMRSMNLSDDSGNPAYSMRAIIGYDQKERGTLLTVDSIYGVGVIRSAHLLDVLS